MKPIFKNLIIATSLLGVLAACQPKDTVQQKDVLHVAANDQMDSDALATAGEELVSPYTFMLADRAFDMALIKDPSNQKALFYKAFLKQLMALRGVIVRVHPFVLKYGSKEKWDAWTLNFPKSPLKDFLMDGQEEAATEETVQNLLINYRNGADEFRRFIKKNPDMNVTVNLNPNVWEQRIRQNLADTCKSQDTSSGFVVNCDTTNIAQVQMNVADLTVLGQMAAGEVAMLTAYTSYSTQGVAQLAKDQDQQIVHNAKYVSQYLQTAGAGKLLKDQSMTLLQALGSDYSAAIKWAIKYQTQLCPSGVSSSQNRPGFMFNQGLCVTDLANTQKSIAILDSVLGGVADLSLQKPDGTQETTKVDILATARNPVVDLFSVGPASFDTCGNVATLKDKTLDGTFVNGNAEEFIVAKSNCMSLK